jgi:hypothetical protein
MERRGGVDVKPIYKFGSHVVAGYRSGPSPDDEFSGGTIYDADMVRRLVTAFNSAPFHKQVLMQKVLGM